MAAVALAVSAALGAVAATLALRRFETGALKMSVLWGGRSQTEHVVQDIFGTAASDSDACSAQDGPRVDVAAATAVLRQATAAAYDNTTGCEDIGPACIVEGSILLFGSSHPPVVNGTFAPVDLPLLDRMSKMMFHETWRAGSADGSDAISGWASSSNPDVWSGTLRHFDRNKPIIMRAGGSRSGLSFSTCTAPLLLWWDFPENFHHTMAAYAALWAAVASGAIDPRVTLSLALPWPPQIGSNTMRVPAASQHPTAGEIMHGPARRSSDFMYSVPSHIMDAAVTTLGFLGNDGQPQRRTVGGAVVTSAERCFAHVPACTISTYARQPPLELWPFMQWLRDTLLSPPSIHRVPWRLTNLTALRAVGQSSLPREEPWLRDPITGNVRITIALRHGNDRTVVNAAALAAACNGSILHITVRHTRKIVPLRTQCQLYYWGSDLSADATHMRDTDVLVGMHGAGLTNAGFLRPGAVLIELRPSSFRASNADRYYRAFAAGTRGALRWWALLLYGSLELPSTREVGRTGNADTWARERSVRVPWRSLTVALQSVLALGEAEWAVEERRGVGATTTDAFDERGHKK